MQGGGMVMVIGKGYAAPPRRLRVRQYIEADTSPASGAGRQLKSLWPQARRASVWPA